MLGGRFEIESAPGGPTTLAVTLPRWEPLNPALARLTGSLTAETTRGEPPALPSSLPQTVAPLR